MRWQNSITVMLVASLLALEGCTPMRRGKSPLAQPQLAPESVVLEVLFVRFPLGDPGGNLTLWDEVDEQQLPAELRRRLAENGFRAGVVSGQIPFSLAKLLDLKDQPAEESATSKVAIGSLQEPPRVERRHLPLRTGARGEVHASGVYEQIPVLFRGDGDVCGECYCQAQGVISVHAFPENDGRVRVELLPELHHGQPRQGWVVDQGWVGDPGVFRPEMGRPRKAFEDLLIEANLAPGDMLLLSSLPNRPGSLGHHFLTEIGDQSDQKLLIVRLAQTQHDDLVLPSEPLTLD